VSQPSEADAVAVPDVRWHAHTPPARHPVPARYVRGLEVGHELTIGIPGRWFVDGQVLACAERDRTTVEGSGEQEALGVAAPFAFWVSRAFPRVEPIMQWWPVAWSWVYRDAVAPGEEHPEGAPPAPDGPGSWLDHVRPSLGEPPVRHPEPARLSGSLTGRTVRLQHERGEWSWWVAVGEPVGSGGDIVVPLMRPTDYWLAQAAFHPSLRARPVPLYRLFTYA
jgi:hypothetical protein